MLSKDVTLFTMHDLVHDLARSVMADEVLDASKKGSIGGSSCRYALLTDCSKPLNLSVISPAKIRALCFPDCGEINLHGAAFSSAKHVRVLDLSGCQIRKLPCSIARLKQLRYLNAPRIHDESFPECITKLSKLNYLNLRESDGISTLPESIGELEGLMHLDLSGCGRIEKLPKSFVKLKDMVHLDLSRCYRVEGVPEALGGLTKLQYLNLSLHDRNLIKLTKLRLSDGELHLRWLPKVIVSLTKLRYLNLSRCMDFIFVGPSTQECDSFIGHISTLSNLEHLDLSYNFYLSIPESIGSLKKLRTLDLSGCRGLERLPESMAKMDSLKALNVKGCDRLDESTLSRSHPFVLLPHFVVHAGDGESTSNLVLLEDANPDDLKISRLENVKSAQEAQSIKLMEKERIKELEFEWTRDAERSVEDMEVLGDLVPPSTLERFKIRGYNSVIFPAWLMDIRRFSPNLNEIEMEDLPNCKCLPPLGQLPNLRKLILADIHGITKIDEGFYGGARAFPQLREFELRGMESLKEWNTIYSSGEEGSNKLMFPKLHTLRIIDLPNCKCLPPLGQVPKLRELLLADLHSITKIDEGFYGVARAFPQLQEFVLRGMKSLEEWNTAYSSGEEGSNELMFPNLWKLTINNCPMLRNMRQLTSLQELILYKCGSMASLSPWLGELTSLKNLYIAECTGIKSLPDSIHQLTNLKYLNIFNCPELKQWCESEDNKKQLAHIEMMYAGP